MAYPTAIVNTITAPKADPTPMPAIVKVVRSAELPALMDGVLEVVAMPGCITIVDVIEVVFRTDDPDMRALGPWTLEGKGAVNVYPGRGEIRDLSAS